MRCKTSAVGCSALTMLVSLACLGQEGVASKCRQPPKIVSAEPIYPASTAIPPEGAVVIELTVLSDGTVRDLVVVQSYNPELDKWAIRKAKDLKFESGHKPCRARIPIELKVSNAVRSA